MNYQFSIKRILIAVSVFALPFAFIRGYGSQGTIVASVIGGSAAGACLLGRSRELRNATIKALAGLGYLIVFTAAQRRLLSKSTLGPLEDFLALGLFWLGAVVLVRLLRHYLHGADPD